MPNWFFIMGSVIAFALSLAFSGFSGTLSYAFYENLDLAPGFGWFGPVLSITTVSMAFLSALASLARLKTASRALMALAVTMFIADVSTNWVIQMDKKAGLDQAKSDYEGKVALAKPAYDLALSDIEKIEAARKLMVSTDKEEIKKAQLLLTLEGGYAGDIDGVRGTKTRAAMGAYKATLDRDLVDARQRRDGNKEWAEKSPDYAGPTFNATMAALIGFGVPALSLFLSWIAGQLIQVRSAKEAKQLSEAVKMAGEALDEERQELRDELAEVRAMRQSRIERETLLSYGT